jgi:hypothetical protein
MMRICRVLVGFAAPVAVAMLVLVGAVPAGYAASPTPYQDPSATGYIGLCDRAGHQITHGSITTKPFAWRAVSSVAAPSPYNDAGRTAILLAYQPRQGLPAGDWSGDELTASARYSNPTHPMTAATAGDDSLKNFIAEFHPMWDGLLQVRMYLGVPEHPTYSLTYPAIDIEVTGNTWHAVDGGPVSCSSGKSESLETMVLPKSQIDPHKHRHHPHRPSSGAKAGGGPSGTASPLAGGQQAAGTGDSASPAAASSSAGSDGGSGDTLGFVIAALLVLALLGAIFMRFRTRFRPLGSSSSFSDGTPKPEKGR